MPWQWRSPYWLLSRQSHRRDRRQTFIPLAHDPGQRLECDFGHIHVDFPDGRRPVPVMVAAWAYSNYPFALAVPTERTEAILAGMVAGRKTGENRWVRAIYRAGTVTARNFAHVLHALWLEVTGFFFLFLAFVGVAAAVREYHRHVAGMAGSGKIYLAAAFAAVFAYFGVSSFWRTRRNDGK